MDEACGRDLPAEEVVRDQPRERQHVGECRPVAVALEIGRNRHAARRMAAVPLRPNR